MNDAEQLALAQAQLSEAILWIATLTNQSQDVVRVTLAQLADSKLLASFARLHLSE